MEIQTVNCIVLPDLVRGSKGKEVKLLQLLLKEGCFNPGAIDGDYGAQTEFAVMKANEKCKNTKSSKTANIETWYYLLNL